MSVQETDRELLELAAKAAGVPAYESTDGTIQARPILVTRCGGGMGTMPYEAEWNPLRDDSTALRLAVKLRMAIYPPEAEEDAAVISTPGVDGEWISEDCAGDPYAATRRAIVRAAAQIGRAMP